jgi:hypothetical protein
VPSSKLAALFDLTWRAGDGPVARVDFESAPVKSLSLRGTHSFAEDFAAVVDDISNDGTGNVAGGQLQSA